MAIRDTSGQDMLVAHNSALPRRKLLLMVATVAALSVAAVLAYPTLNNWSMAEHSIDLDSVRLAEVTRGTLTRDINAQGLVVASIKPTLFSPTSGVVTLHVNPGDAVKNGQLVCTIDSPELASQLQQEESSLISAETAHNRNEIQAKLTTLKNRQTIDLTEVALTAARRELRRAEKAHSQQAISEFDFDKANDDVATAELRFRHASEDARLQEENLAFELQTSRLQIDQQRLRVSELERRVEELLIRSPVDGIIGNLSVQNKDAVSINQPIVTVVDLSAFELELQVPDSYTDGLALGLDAEISYAGNLLRGLVVSISPEVVNSQIRLRVRFVNDPPDNLKQNQRVSARILIESRDQVLMVKRGPFLESGGGRTAYVVDGKLARKQQITIGATSVEAVEVLSGLTENQRIIISSSREFDNAAVVYLTD